MITARIGVGASAAALVDLGALGVSRAATTPLTAQKIRNPHMSATWRSSGLFC
jgi:hypothetical protein